MLPFIFWSLLGLGIAIFAIRFLRRRSQAKPESEKTDVRPAHGQPPENMKLVAPPKRPSQQEQYYGIAENLRPLFPDLQHGQPPAPAKPSFSAYDTPAAPASQETGEAQAPEPLNESQFAVQPCEAPVLRTAIPADMTDDLTEEQLKDLEDALEIENTSFVEQVELALPRDEQALAEETSEEAPQDLSEELLDAPTEKLTAEPVTEDATTEETATELPQTEEEPFAAQEPEDPTIESDPEPEQEPLVTADEPSLATDEQEPVAESPTVEPFPSSVPATAPEDGRNEATLFQVYRQGEGVPQLRLATNPDGSQTLSVDGTDIAIITSMVPAETMRDMAEQQRATG